MGSYLNKPKTDKTSGDIESNSRYDCGYSGMQGWRSSMEDAHNCNPNVKDDVGFFGVYDGHGGSEVAAYCAIYFLQTLMRRKEWKEENYEEALRLTFLELDSELLSPTPQRELKHLSQIDSEKPLPTIEELKKLESEWSESEDEDEARLLAEEANMNIEDVLARYQQNIEQEEAEIKEESSSISKDKRDESTSAKKPEEKEIKKEVKEEKKIKQEPIEEKEVKKEVKDEKGIKKEIKQEAKEIKQEAKEIKQEAKEIKQEAKEIKQEAKEEKEPKKEAPKEEKMEVERVEAEQKYEPKTTQVKEEGTKNGAEENGSGKTTEEKKSDEAVSRSPKKLVKVKPPKKQKPQETEEDEDDDEDFVWDNIMSNCEDGENSDDDDDEEEEEEEEDDSEDDSDAEGENEDGIPVHNLAEFLRAGGASNNQFAMEIPGADSGTTAVVALLIKNKLIVANAGDSRCVVSRNGKAFDMSDDHKPEDTIELERITKAGGHVNDQGRVNGGLNLSRAIGDHCYKKNESLSLREQMITALPDLRTIELKPTDDFMVLACDGIWNVMDSQEVVDFVRERLSGGGKSEKSENGKSDAAPKLSTICEELFDKCMAPDTMGDGTGCDNMTCMIVRFDHDWLRSCAAAQSNGCGDAAVTSSGKRQLEVDEGAEAEAKMAKTE